MMFTEGFGHPHWVTAQRSLTVRQVTGKHWHFGLPRSRQGMQDWLCTKRLWREVWVGGSSWHGLPWAGYLPWTAFEVVRISKTRWMSRHTTIELTVAGWVAWLPTIEGNYYTPWIRPWPLLARLGKIQVQHEASSIGWIYRLPSHYTVVVNRSTGLATEMYEVHDT